MAYEVWNFPVTFNQIQYANITRARGNKNNKKENQDSLKICSCTLKY